MEMPEKIKEITKFLKENKKEIKSLVLAVETNNGFEENALIPSQPSSKLKMIGFLEAIKLDIHSRLEEE